MGEEKTFTTSAVTHPRYVRTFRALKRRIGRSLELHDPVDPLCDAVIFVFNRFAAFEIAHLGGTPAVDNHSIRPQALRDRTPRVAARSAVPLTQWLVSEGTA